MARPCPLKTVPTDVTGDHHARLILGDDETNDHSSSSLDMPQDSHLEAVTQTSAGPKAKKRLRFDLLSVLPHRRRARHSSVDDTSTTLSPSSPYRHTPTGLTTRGQPSLEDFVRDSVAVHDVALSEDAGEGNDSITMSGAIPPQVGIQADFMFSSPGFGNHSTNSGWTTPATSSSFSLIAFAKSPAKCGSEIPRLSGHLSPLRSSASAVYQVSSCTPSSAYRRSAMSLPLNMEWMAARSDSLPDLPTACISTVPSLSRSYSAPGIALPTSELGIGRTSALPDTILGSLLLYLDYGSYKALRMTWRSQSASVRILLPIAQRLPVEIIEYILVYLPPNDFNAARYTCENWFKASLKPQLLILQLRRGGWWNAAQQDLEDLRLVENVDETFTLEQILSLRLAKECALAGVWSKTAMAEHDSPSCPNPFTQIAVVEFSNLHVEFKKKDLPRLQFTVSTCGLFLLAARDRSIFIYAFTGGGLRPVCNVVCPRRVMALSMDVSSKHNVVAALLEGRCGILADLYDATKVFHSNSRVASDLLRQAATTEEGPLTSRLANVRTWDSCCPAAGSAVSSSNLFPLEEPEIEPATEPELTPSGDSTHVQEPSDDLTQSSDKTTRVYRGRTPGALVRHVSWTRSRKALSEPRSNKKKPLRPPSESRMPFVTAPKSVYRHLGSDFDPPKSVAICPSRRCVAFGCAGGIELHWADALTQHESHRWFPLTQPADFLYFLRPCQDLDSAKKLRIISSAASSTGRHSIRRFAQRAAGGLTSMWPASTSHKAEAVLAGVPTRRIDSEERDHVHAVPLSDGFHILFTDPVTNFLCLGSDAPLEGPNRLARIINFIPPACLGHHTSMQHSKSGGEPPQPAAYAAAPDLTRGVRVAAAYGDRVVFYSVPSDVLPQSFAARRGQAPATSAHASTIFAGSTPNTEWLS